jgi:hypothetical protein
MTEDFDHYIGEPNDPKDVTADSTDAELLRWFFWCKPVRDFVGFAINAGDLLQALRDLAYACRKYPGDADEVLLAYRYFMNVAGPPAVGQFLSTGNYRAFCPYVPEVGTSSMAVVWEQGMHRVVARSQFRRDEPVDIRFDVEDVTVGHGGPF